MPQSMFQPPATNEYALVGSIFDSHTGALVPNQAVHIRGNQIVTVCAPGDFRCLTSIAPERVVEAALECLQ